MLNLKLQEKISCSEIRKRTKIIEIMKCTLKQKWGWAGHIARMKDNRRTKCCTEWQLRRGKRSRGRRSRLQDDKTRKEATTWNRKSNRQRTIESIDGEIHSTVDGQRLGERCVKNNSKIVIRH